MTLWASREGQKIAIHGNAGLSVKVENDRETGFTVSDDLGPMRALWGSLGTLIAQAEAENEGAV